MQLDHIVPKARGGKPVIGNLRLLCAPHNKLAAHQKLGHALMNRYCKDPMQPLLAGLPGDASDGWSGAPGERHRLLGERIVTSEPVPAAAANPVH